ncbi:helix-turn-helix transcriptional regulator [Streptomyces sp. SID3343]|uniref:helix-turn-helix domain-containing protein n=1 Tax=Streptomyces sp. SID3343 TaxID=2690260 RepID=UPI001367BDA5|nr:helix-turn-helix transcriptional regulator [Streptomyces sp. SID3343]MYW06069.1 helix-turn-helix domain-containing protein [Streptomyces sp. SID3343]
MSAALSDDPWSPRPSPSRSDAPSPTAAGPYDDAAKPAAAVKVLGTILRSLRVDCGLGLKEAADVIRGSASKISRLERGESPPKHRDVFDLVAAYGVHDQTQLAVIEDLLRKANQRAWWQQYGDVTPGWLRRLISLEDSATQIRSYEVHVVPGLLQTPDYARAVIKAGLPNASPAEIERRVELRVLRQQVLRCPERPLMLALLDESILWRPVGGDRVMARQMRALREATERDGIHVRVVCFDKGASITPPSSITLLKFAHGGLAEMVYLEQIESATYLSRTSDVERYRHVLDLLRAVAESRRSSLAMLRSAELHYSTRDPE